ncbi:cobalamin biosynthesis protein [filamentous cyanobacterium CCP5]|nr:cobalamin biosynthesis protein [filamentous cyanobacterium CCP5]
MGRALWSDALGLGLAAWLDFLVGDPWGWPHPVQMMGWVISRYRQAALGLCKHRLALRIAGIGLGLGLTLGSGVVGWGLVAIARSLHPFLAMAVQTILLASCLAGRSLRRAAEDVLAPLAAGDLPAARNRLGLYVGRDTDGLDRAEVLRAVLETVSENSTDGVTAPLFYAILGTCVPVIGPVPVALGYKAVSTLDSMVGYKDPLNKDLGWFSARLEDALTWIPCRLTVVTIAVLARHPVTVLRLCRRDAPQDPSPNAGWSECAYAAALGVQMGGLNHYRGQPKLKPLLGDAHQPISLDTIQAALALTRWTVLLWLAIAIGLLLRTTGFS